MTRFEKDMFRVLCGAGEEALARREEQIAEFEAEHNKCLNPFRKALLGEEIIRERRELESLRRQHRRCAASSTTRN